MAGIALLTACNLLGMAIIVTTQQTVDAVKKGIMESLAVQLCIIAIMATFMLAFRIASRQLLLGIGRVVEHDLRNSLYQKLLTLPASFYTVYPTGEIMSRLINDVQALRYLAGGGSLLGFNTLFNYAMALPVMLFYSPRLTLYTFLLFPVAIFLMGVISHRVKTHYIKVQSILGDISTLAQENFSGMPVIQSYVKEEVEDRHFQSVSQRYRDAFFRLIRLRVVLFLIMASVTSLGVLIVFMEGGQEYAAGVISPGVFVAFILLLERLSWPTAALGWTVTMLQQGKAALERLDDIFSATSSLEKDASSYCSPFPYGALTIRDLSFTYQNPYQSTPATIQGQPSPSPTLHHIHLHLSPGKTYVLVGPLGCGKTTLLQLIAKQAPVEAGRIFIGGRDITKMPVSAVRNVVTYMPQHSFLFSTTVENNISYGQPDAPSPLILTAAESAAIHDEVMRFSQQYGTLLGERGMTLSGGQRQRLSLARALLIEPRILLLDDPFSHVDSRTEQVIIRAFKSRQQMKGKITLIATHRLSVVQRADAVVLMDQGRIVSVGTHEELLATQPLYGQLHRQEQRRMAESFQDLLNISNPADAPDGIL